MPESSRNEAGRVRRFSNLTGYADPIRPARNDLTRENPCFFFIFNLIFSWVGLIGPALRYSSFSLLFFFVISNTTEVGNRKHLITLFLIL